MEETADIKLIIPSIGIPDNAGLTTRNFFQVMNQEQRTHFKFQIVSQGQINFPKLFRTNKWFEMLSR